MCIRLLHPNYTNTGVVNASTVSSEQSSFPASNLYDNKQRSKVWRSAGYWDIQSGSNTIVIREGGGDLVATITVGVYTSDTALFAEIKTQLETAGALTYTITRESTQKVKIAASGTFELRNNSTMLDTIGYNPATNYTGATEYEADDVALHTSEWLKWDLGIATNPKAFIAMGNRNDSLQISPTATVTLEGNTADVWTSPAYSQTLTYNDEVLAIYDSTGLHTEPLRWWRLKIVDTDNSNGYVQLSGIFLGDWLDITRGAVQFPFTMTKVDQTNTVYAYGGESFSDIREKSERFNLSWFGLTVAEKEEIDTHWDFYGRGKPMFVVLDPNQTFSSTANYMTRYVKYDSEPGLTLISPANFGGSMVLREQL